MNSHNQPSFGSVDVWFYKYLAGIKTTGPGFSDISIRPFVPGDLDSAEACIDTIRGKVASSWKKEGNKLELTVTIPWNSRAHIELPPGMDGRKAAQVSLEDGSTVRELVFERPCGTWRFTVQYE
jgi:alpha-L-rhamnosidase